MSEFYNPTEMGEYGAQPLPPLPTSDAPVATPAPPVAHASDEVAMTAMRQVDLSSITPAVGEAVRHSMVAMMRGSNMTEAAAAGGFREEELLALMVSNQQVMHAMVGVMRSLGMKSWLKVMELAGRAEHMAGGHVGGLRLAIGAHQWIATNVIPEMLARAAATGDKKKHMDAVAQGQTADDHRTKELDTGVPDD